MDVEHGELASFSTGTRLWAGQVYETEEKGRSKTTLDTWANLGQIDLKVSAYQHICRLSYDVFHIGSSQPEWIL